MSDGLKSDFGKYVFMTDVSAAVDGNQEPPPTIRVTIRDDPFGVLQLTESMRKSVEVVTDLLVHTTLEETRARFLAEASLRLFASSGEDATFVTLSRLFVPMLADGACFFSIHGDDVRCRAVAHADPAKERFVLALAKALGGEAGKHTEWIEHVFDRGLCIELSGQTLANAVASLSNDRDVSEASSGLGIHWLEGWPLVSNHRVLGAIFLFGGTLRHKLDIAGGDMLQSLAHCASLAVDNAQVHDVARQSIRAREHLMAVSAHDLRNSLSLALMSLSTIDGVGEGSNGTLQKSRIALLRKGLGRMQRLVDDLLDFSTIETGHLSISSTEQSVTTIVDEAMEAFREAALLKGITLVGRKPAEPCRIDCDAFRLFQVLSNLLGNALKFTPMGGKITVTAIDYVDEVEFSVSDTGCGIAPTELPRIFEAYRRAARSRLGGVGLGLSIAKGIVESHGGRMGVESRLGEGTVFFFRLPKRAPLNSKIDGV